MSGKQLLSLRGRILADHDGCAVPLFGAAGALPLSPSPTLLIETYQVQEGAQHSHRIPTQMVSMFLRPCVVAHAQAGHRARELRMAARSVAISLRDQSETLAWMSGAEFISVSLDERVLGNACQQLTTGARVELRAAPGLQDERLSALLYALYLEQAAGFPSGRLLIDGIEQALAALLVTQHNAHAPRLASAPDGLPAHCARRVLDFMHANLAEPVSLAMLAHCAGYSEAHFSRLFRSRFGASPHHFLLQLRIEHARLLLRRGAMPLVDIALACGFANAAHFSRTFSRIAGQSPVQFRRAGG